MQEDSTQQSDNAETGDESSTSSIADTAPSTSNGVTSGRFPLKRKSYKKDDLTVKQKRYTESSCEKIEGWNMNDTQKQSAEFREAIEPSSHESFGKFVVTMLDSISDANIIERTMLDIKMLLLKAALKSTEAQLSSQSRCLGEFCRSCGSRKS